MPQVKRKTPEQFVAQSPIGERLLGGVILVLLMKIQSLLRKRLTIY